MHIASPIGLDRQARQHGGASIRVLVFGAGVIGIAYGWAFAQGGHDVTLLARPGRGDTLRAGVRVTGMDMRRRPTAPIHATYVPRVVEDLSAADGYELVVVTVRHNQWPEVLPWLGPRIGPADVLFFGNMWTDDEDIRKALPAGQYLFGFPSAGGGMSGSALEIGLGARPTLGEMSGERTPRLLRIERLFRDAGFRPRLSNRILPWLWVHYVTIAGLLCGIAKAGSARAYAASPAVLRESFLAAREGLDVCRARGVRLRGLPGTLGLRMPLPLVVRVARRAYRTPLFETMMDGHLAHAHDEMRKVYEDVVETGTRLDVPMPVLRSFGPYIERL